MRYYCSIISEFLFLTTLSLLLVAVSAAELHGQEKYGQLSGVVVSEKTGEKLIGINVTLQNTKLGASTDIEGKFVISKIPYGLYTIRVSGIGLQTKTISGYAISKSRTEDVFTLSDQVYNLAEISVTAERIRNTEAAVLAERKKMTEISDIISAEQIKRSPDATSGDALKRVTGLTIVDNKFIFVRGISDRYNSAMLDGGIVSSTEAGKKGFSFDLIPSNLLENTTVIKSASPELPGDFSGGLVKMRTLDFPGENTLKVSYGSTYNDLSTGGTFQRSLGGNTDWLGFDDGTRKLPSFTNANEIATKMPNSWAPKQATAPMNKTFAISSGNQMTFNSGDETPDQLGSVLSLTYRNTYQKNNRIRNDADNGRYYVGTKDDYSVLWGALANASYKFGGNHIISIRNTFNQSASDQISVGSADQSSDQRKYKFYELNWIQRSNYNGQLAGEHGFLLNDKSASDVLHVDWRIAVASSKKEEPDRKKASYSADVTDSLNAPYDISTNKRSWDKMHERAFTYGLDNVLPLHAIVPFADGKFKFGGFYETKKTDYRIRYFDVLFNYPTSASPRPTHAQDSMITALQRLPIDQVYMPQNFIQGVRDNKTFLFYMNEVSTPQDSYKGDLTLLAGYAMADIPFSIFEQNFRLSGGARLENSLIEIYNPLTNDPEGPSEKQQKKNIDILPSLNFTYKISELINFRFAYYHTINRPDFRELAKTTSYDYVLNEQFSGNPDLSRSYIKNIDFRAEFFPEIGEVIAVSYFTKTFSGAIEERLMQSSTPLRQYFNSEYAENKGWEFEIKKSLGFIHSWLSDFVLAGNYTTVNSKVKVSTTTGNSIETRDSTYYRPLQGQSPYSLNVTLSYNHPSLGTSINILFNKFGRRLYMVGFQSADIYEESVDMVDLTVNQPIMSVFELKFAVRNLADKDKTFTRENGLYERITQGRSFSLMLSYKL